MLKPSFDRSTRREHFGKPSPPPHLQIDERSGLVSKSKGQKGLTMPLFVFHTDFGILNVLHLGLEPVED